MRKRLLKWLICPFCQSNLNLIVAEFERSAVTESDRVIFEAVDKVQLTDEIDVEIVTGALTCAQCNIYYPIDNGVPRMLTYSTEVMRDHAKQNSRWLDEHLSAFHLPNAFPPPGEMVVLRNFSTEWQGYEWNGKRYWESTPENILRCIRYSLGIPRHSLRHKLCLEVGIGIGGTADALSRAESCELVGMDLGYSVDGANRYFGQNRRLHVVQASVFAPPFRPCTFDVVYSHGVLHHTYSTQKAFSKVAQLPKLNGGMLYIWVYSNEQEQSTVLRRALMVTERAVRPVLSKLSPFTQTVCLVPVLPLYILYQNLYRRHQLGKQFAATYGWKEALHAARDRLTPPFAYRHTYAEVAGWFKSNLYQDLELLRDESLPDGVPDTYALNVGVRGFRGPKSH
jgi:uncharacterized protein YbaR (Trm112 family)